MFTFLLGARASCPQRHDEGGTPSLSGACVTPGVNRHACCYHERWEIEITSDAIDTHQCLVGRTLRSLTPMGVIQEPYGMLLAHYAVRVLVHEAALGAEGEPDRLSFVHALEIVRDAVPAFQQVAPAQRRALYERMLHAIAASRVPERRPRSNPRVVKRKMSNFKLSASKAPRKVCGVGGDPGTPVVERSSQQPLPDGSGCWTFVNASLALFERYPL